MSNMKKIILTLGLVFSLGLIFAPVPLGAQTVLEDYCAVAENNDTVICKQNAKPLTDYIKPIVNTLLFVLGAVSVVMIILGGIKYTTSSGDTKNVESAKNTIMYSVIGLVVAILAGAIVNFVLTSLK